MYYLLYEDGDFQIISADKRGRFLLAEGEKGVDNLAEITKNLGLKTGDGMDQIMIGMHSMIWHQEPITIHGGKMQSLVSFPTNFRLIPEQFTYKVIQAKPIFWKWQPLGCRQSQ